LDKEKFGLFNKITKMEVFYMKKKVSLYYVSQNYKK